MKNRRWGSLALLVLSSAVACGGPDDSGTVDVTGAALEGPSLAAGDAGGLASIKTDELLTVTLSARASAGYTWQVDGIDGKVLRLAGREHVSSLTLGGEDQEILRFAGVAKGRTTLQLSYRRPWEGVGKLMASGAETPTFTATVEVGGAYTGTYRDPSATPAMPKAEPQGLTATTLPSAYTFCNASTCTPVKDQGQCGGCWAFATVGVMEQAEKAASGATVNLSEQHLISCNTSSYSCAKGGLQGFPWYYQTADKMGLVGTVYQADYPFTGTDSTCKSKTHHEKLTSWTQITSGTASTTQLKQAIYDHGAVWVAVCADSTWDNYTGGVYKGSSSCTSTNHAVVLTGWDDSTGTFLLRNSWGSSWGESGYMRIKYGVNGVGDMASYAQYTSTCTPSCSGKTCGSDGCGGTCGTCASGQTCSSAGQCTGGTSTCAHAICTTGTKLTSTCDACASKICAADSYCCSTGWDATCVGEVSSICGQSCSGSCTPACSGKTCGSDGCGGTCGTCASGQTCSSSGQCAATSCAHSICTTGTKLTSSCDTCASKICAADSYCCSTGWDATCVSEVSSICGTTCN